MESRFGPHCTDQGREPGPGFKSAYEAIVDHQQWYDDWSNGERVSWLRRVADTLIRSLDIRVIKTRDLRGVERLNLETIKGVDLLGVPLIRVEKMNVKTIGSFNRDPDGYALAGTISFNECRLPKMERCIIAAYVLKFLLCAWRSQTGGSGKFDKAAKAKMRSYGVVIGDDGIVAILPEGLFGRQLETLKIDFRESIEPPEKPKGRSTLTRWNCNCGQKARVGTRSFKARCLICGGEFKNPHQD